MTAKATRMKWKTPVKILISSLLLVYVARSINIRSAMGMIAGAHAGFLVLAFLVETASNFTGAFCWLMFLRAEDRTFSFFRAVYLYWIGLFFNIVLPSNIGGDAVKAVAAVHGVRRWYPRAAGIINDRLINLAAMILIGFCACILFSLKNRSIPAYLTISTAGGIICIVVFSAVVTNRVMAKIVITVQRRWFKMKVFRLFSTAVIVLSQMKKKNKKLLFAAALSALITQFLRIWFYSFLMRGLMCEIPDTLLFMVFPVIGIVSMIPVTIGGIGVREYAGAYFARVASLDVTAFTTLVFAGYAVVVLSGCTGIVIFFFIKKNISKSLN